MRIPALISLLLAAFVLAACSPPITAIGILGSVITNSMEDDEDQQQSGRARPQPDARQIAVTNLNLGVEYMRLGEHEQALSKLNRARVARPDYAPVYDALGLLYQKMGQTAEAERHFRHAVKLDPGNPLTLNNYGQFLCSQGREAEAEDYFMTAAANPFYHTPEIPYSNIGTCAYLHGRTDKAAEFFARALSINPGMPGALIHMSEISCSNGDYVAAQDYLMRYLNLTGHTPRSLWLGIRIERGLGDKNAVSSYALLLRNQYPDSNEAGLLRESGIR